MSIERKARAKYKYVLPNGVLNCNENFVKVYVQGYNDAVEKACQVLNELFYQANHNDTKIFINKFKKTMEK